MNILKQRYIEFAVNNGFYFLYNREKIKSVDIFEMDSNDIIGVNIVGDRYNFNYITIIMSGEFISAVCRGLYSDKDKDFIKEKIDEITIKQAFAIRDLNINKYIEDLNII